MAEEKKYERSIELLNKALAGENTASLQYMLFHVICEDKGYRPLAKYFKKTAIEEMRHSEMLAERILFLGGEIKMVLAKGIKNMKTVQEMLDYARQLEKDTIEDYNAWGKEASANGDGGTRKMFQELLVQEEGHMDQYRLEMENMEQFGDEYLALQVLDNLKHAE
ncbi:MAG: bacterioferritin [Rikenellaceae bacterium]|jgi:bacterioferritin|nr:bacterioferritin [Rikenellaceae bacterium]